MISINNKVGILGGGQLGRMFIQEAINYDIHIAILDPNENCPCSNICNEFVKGDFNNYEDVLSFGKELDVITIEIEHVNVEALYELQKMGKKVFPQPRVIELIKDKGLQKSFYEENNIPTSPFTIHESADEVKNNDFPFVVKSRKGGYDGKGVAIINDHKDFSHPIFLAPYILEEKVDFIKELSIIIARNESGDVEVYPMVEQEFNAEANLVEFLFSPAKVDDDVEKKGKVLAKQIIEKLNMVGLLAIEFFLTKDGDLLVNEMAPRPHNSGHHTIESNICSQFEQHLRSILNFPLGSTESINAGVMVNLLGDKSYKGEVVYKGLNEVLSMHNVYPHLYGKKETKPYRKMGHITITDKSIQRAIEKAQIVKDRVKVISKNKI